MWTNCFHQSELEEADIHDKDLCLTEIVIVNLLMKKLILAVPNTIIAEFANTVDPDETAHN